MIDWEKYRRDGMNRACAIDLCKAFDDIYSFELSESSNSDGKRAIAHARLKECERLMPINSRQEAAGLLSGVAFTLGLAK